jgi:outer membrane lipoprotein carrier protein
MKKALIILFAAIGLINLSFIKDEGQNDPKAQEILDAMSKKYKEMTSFKAKFSYTLENETNPKLKETQEGEILVKGSKFKLKLGGQEIFNNGTTVWTYMKESNEVNVSSYQPEEDELNPTKIYTMYKKGYKYILISENTEGGKVFATVDLEPLDRKKSQVSKVRIVINKKDKLVKSWKIFEKNGNRYNYNVKNFEPNVKAEDAEFNFDKTKYPGVTEIDLR